MHPIRHLPEGLFILLVNLGPSGVAYVLAPTMGWRFLLVLLLAMICGFALWLATCFIAWTLLNRRNRTKSE